MAFHVNDGLIKVVQKLTLLLVTAYLYTIFSSVVPSCSIIKAGWKIYPFDKKFFISSTLFMASAATTIVECNVWPYNTKPHNKIIKFFGELYIMTTCIMLVYALFWHPIVIITSISTDKLSVLTSEWLGTSNIYKKSIPICMENVRSTKYHTILLGALLLHNVLLKLGMCDLRRIRNSF